MIETPLKKIVTQNYMTERERQTIMSEDISSDDYLCPSMTGTFIRCRYWVESSLVMKATSCFNTWPRVEMPVTIFPAALVDVGRKN